MLELKKIKKSYKTGDFIQHALKGINVQFRENEFVSILGPSGSGKTTLLNIVGGLDNYTSGDLIINDETKQVEVEGREVKLTPTEYNILKFLTKNKGIVYSIEQIYENVWEEQCFGAENIIAVHIRHIREKMEINPKEPKYLKVIWGIGYKIEKM